MTHRFNPVFNPTISEEVLHAALTRIPPLWPLRHFVAVNPFLGLAHETFENACEIWRRAYGSAPLLSREEYRAMWLNRTISAGDLSRVADQRWSSELLLESMEKSGGQEPPEIPTFADFLDTHQSRSHWGSLVVEEISKWCAVTFDRNQTTWNSPWVGTGFYRDWKAAAIHDLTTEAFGLRGFRRFVATLPDDPNDAIRTCMANLAPKTDTIDFLHRELVTVAGWAGHLQYLVREDSMRGRVNYALRDLLAIRLTFDAALQAAFGSEPGISQAWAEATGKPGMSASTSLRVRWQAAYEAGYQRRLAGILSKSGKTQALQRPKLQAVFCIDVRSEVLRRHLEATDQSIRTIGFAGFFGFPVLHQPAIGEAGSRCPVLLSPSLETCDAVDSEYLRSARVVRAEEEAWRAVQNSATSCFSFVETLGIGFAAVLNKANRSSVPFCERARPVLKSGDAPSLDAKASMAEAALRNMGLTRGFARLVLICGHGSRSANNPYASGLDCGACGGHSGDVNARLAAAALNDPPIRAALEVKGIRIPEDTRFVAGLHNTVTDEVTVFEDDVFPQTHAGDLAELRRALTEACSATRQERADALGIRGASEEGLVNMLIRRSEDISEVRPEWGLANNAAFVAAPRSRTAGHNLEGRVFLHDYDSAADSDSRVLTLILSAPVVVASWINLQYYASRVDPKRLGSGNKVLHNVVGGIGVVEGNGGDLRVGLPLQSIHDGKRFIHEPRRLSVFVEAEPAKIDAVLQANPAVLQLFNNGWIHLFSIWEDSCRRFVARGWERES